jgi:hypothetical protein
LHLARSATLPDASYFNPALNNAAADGDIFATTLRKNNLFVATRLVYVTMGPHTQRGKIMNQTSNTEPAATITVPVSQVDANATPTGETTLFTLTAEQLSDILSHAVQVCTAQQAGLETDAIIDELSEALSSYGIF